MNLLYRRNELLLWVKEIIQRNTICDFFYCIIILHLSFGFSFCHNDVCKDQNRLQEIRISIKYRVNEEKLRWIGHVLRKENANITKNALRWTPA